MKRRKKLKTKRGQSIEEDGTIGNARVSISELPIQLVMDIHSRLSLKSIFRCRSVCKLWLQILLTSDFAKLHFSRARACPLLHNPDPNGKTISKVLYLLDIQRDRLCYICDGHRRSKKLCASFYRDYEEHVDMKISTRFMLPNLHSNSETKRDKRKFKVVNSCKGLLCLRTSLPKDPIVIYNPVTSEYTLIPSPIEDGSTNFFSVGGLGFCQRINKFKLLVLLRKWTRTPQGHIREYLAFVYTLGSGIWRTIGNVPPSISNELTNPTFLNGGFHWLVGDSEFNQIFIIYFDLDDEQFKSMLPPHWNTMYCFDKIKSKHLDRVSQDNWSPTIFSDSGKKSLGVLRDQIFVCETDFDFQPDVWALRDYDDQQSWFKMFEFPSLPPGLYQPIEFLEDGDLLLHQANNGFVTSGRYNFKYFKIRGFRTKFQVIPHIPSFLSLKEVLGDNTEVLIVRPSESRLKTSQLRLVEENWECLSDYWED